MVNDRNKRGIHTVRGRLGSPRTPMIAFNSVIVTCLARSTACATCCWCCGDRGWVRAGHVAPRQVPPMPRGHPDPPLFIFFIIVFNFFLHFSLPMTGKGLVLHHQLSLGTAEPTKPLPGSPLSSPPKVLQHPRGTEPRFPQTNPSPPKSCSGGGRFPGEAQPPPGARKRPYLL